MKEGTSLQDLGVAGRVTSTWIQKLSLYFWNVLVIVRSEVLRMWVTKNLAASPLENFLTKWATVNFSVTTWCLVVTWLPNPNYDFFTTLLNASNHRCRIWFTPPWITKSLLLSSDGVNLQVHSRRNMKDK